MEQLVCPCKDCKIREVGCHSVCGLYKEWYKEDHKRRLQIKLARINYMKMKNSCIMKRDWYNPYKQNRFRSMEAQRYSKLSSKKRGR